MKREACEGKVQGAGVKAFTKFVPWDKTFSIFGICRLLPIADPIQSALTVSRTNINTFGL